MSQDVYENIFPFPKGSSCNDFSKPPPPLPITDDTSFDDVFYNKDTDVPQDLTNDSNEGEGFF